MVASAPPFNAVLHVDDSPADLYRRRRVLQAAGFHVVDAENATAAWEAFHAGSPDLLLLDVKLPGTSGFDIARQIRAEALARGRDVGIVLISAYFTESEFRVRGLDSGADAYLIEPTSDPELVATIKAVARRLEDARSARRTSELLNVRTAELRTADQAKNDFLATVVHEIREPLQAALAGIGVLRARRDRAGGERARDLIERQLRQIARITDDLLDATRVVRGQISLQHAPRDLCGIVGRAAETVESVAARQGVRLKTDLPEQPLAVTADQARLEQVFVNLLANAIRHTPGGGEVTVSAEAEGQAARVCVRDTGEGIPADRLPRIFDLFVRGEGSKGLGIGLAVARALVEAHDGRLEAQSAGPGQGSAFIVTLPLDRG